METLNVNFVRLFANAKQPVKAHETDGGSDLYAREVTQEKGGTVLVKFGIAMEIPEGWCARISPRSSFTKTGWAVTNSPALIDCSYRGEIMLRYTPVSNKPFPYEEGDRAAQMTFERVPRVLWNEQSSLSDSERGEGGFGSSGQK